MGRSFAVHFPDGTLTNDQLAERFSDFTAAKIENKLGIRSRPRAAEGETALDLAEQAARKLLQQRGDDPPPDFLLVCTQNPEYLLPATACLLQERLGLPRSTGALDITLGCSGFIYGLALANGLLASGVAQRVLSVYADTFSRFVAPDDRGNQAIFGDAAAALWLTRDTPFRIGRFILGTDGRGAEHINVEAGGARERAEPGRAHRPYFHMNGPEVFNFELDEVPPLINAVLAVNGVAKTDIDHFVFQQANKHVLTFLRDKLGLAADRFVIDVADTGNTASASIPIVLERLIDTGAVRPGQRLLLAGFGVGYSYGAVVVDYLGA